MHMLVVGLKSLVFLIAVCWALNALWKLYLITRYISRTDARIHSIPECMRTDKIAACEDYEEGSFSEKLSTREFDRIYGRNE